MKEKEAATRIGLALEEINRAWELYVDKKITLAILFLRLIDFTATISMTFRKIKNSHEKTS